MTARLAALAVAAALVVVAACGSPAGPEAAPAPATAAKPQAKAAASPDAGVAIAANVPYMYNPIGKRDPFRSPEEQTRTSDKGGLECNEPLCGFDLDQLQLVAVVSGDANPVAMVEDGQKVGYVVRRNSRVGKQGGKVTQIQRDCVVVTEYFQTPDGKVNPNRVNLCIKTDKRSVPVLDLLQNKLYEPQ